MKAISCVFTFQQTARAVILPLNVSSWKIKSGASVNTSCFPNLRILVGKDTVGRGVDHQTSGMFRYDGMTVEQWKQQCCNVGRYLGLSEEDLIIPVELGQVWENYGGNQVTGSRVRVTDLNWLLTRQHSQTSTHTTAVTCMNVKELYWMNNEHHSGCANIIYRLFLGEKKKHMTDIFLNGESCNSAMIKYQVLQVWTADCLTEAESAGV